MDELATATRRVVSREQEMKFGTQITATGVRFRLWAPQVGAISVRIHDPAETVPMQARPRGWHEIEIEGIGAGTRYSFVLDDGREVPDPASRFQPEDVLGPSEVIDPLEFEWHDIGWRGRPWEETVAYELHVGTFTPEGSFLAAIDKLDHLVALGVTAIELMPIADFSGRWNWGYDGVLLFAPDASYGRPEDLKALVDACHARGLMVFLDVVYNHFGPHGNYMNIYAPQMTEAHHTPWGPAVNYDDEGSAMIREFVFANTRYWLNEYRFDGLRFDAVHEIRDGGPKHMLQDMAEQTRASTDGRFIHLIAENSLNQADWLKQRWDGTPWLYNAQWNDDFHHSLHSVLTGETQWYYADFAGRIDLLGRALAEGFAWQGEFMPNEGKNRGEPSAYLPPTSFVSFIQNHDQAGNRPFGERIGHLVPAEATRAITALYLLSPQIPLLFMGEEWAASTLFLFFSDITDLADAIRASRLEELGKFPSKPGMTPPDPVSGESFTGSKLRWEEVGSETAARHLSLYRRLLEARHKEIVPRLSGMQGFSGSYQVIGLAALKVSWTLADGAVLVLWANLSADPIAGTDVGTGQHLWVEGQLSADALQAWTVVYDLTRP